MDVIEQVLAEAREDFKMAQDEDQTLTDMVFDHWLFKNPAILGEISYRIFGEYVGDELE